MNLLGKKKNSCPISKIRQLIVHIEKLPFFYMKKYVIYNIYLSSLIISLHILSGNSCWKGEMTYE
ncbi:hypothetical protein DWY77_00305 [Megamonas rupellensis]|uniref:Uncharacterized protein n=1 Tax=Megamonas rupellensis TaxID=491921 RepID=A0A412CI36_9FIRM|nr:hypothetical protein DWY77_00305 [Megamonas rupellensis]HJG04647.1 hypothetical protein [Megamonas funiformis]